MAAALLGSVALLGWLFGDDELKSVVPGQVTMKPNTAIGLILAGVALAAIARRPGRRPRIATFVAVADVFDALTHDRVYKEAWPTEQALEEIRTQSGRQFDPDVVEAFLSAHGLAKATRTGAVARPARAAAESDSITIPVLRPQPSP